MDRDQILTFFGLGKSIESIGRPSLIRQLLRIRFLAAFAVSAPALFLAGWYVYAAVVQHSRYNHAAKKEQKLTWDLFHLHLHDRLSQERRRLVAPQPSNDSNLPTYSLMVGNVGLDTLDKTLPPKDGQVNYVNGYLKKGRNYFPVRARYRGSRHWHWNYPQKSFKVRLTGGQFLNGRQTLNFINTAEPLPFDEQVVLELAREQGLLTPDYYPFRLLLNNVYLGVYFFSTQPDEGLLRNNRRIPGSIFSGNDAPKDKKTGISALWQKPAYWKKVAWRLQTKQELDYTELEQLLDVVNRGSDAAFRDFAEEHLDLLKFAQLDALDVVFGVNQHDFAQNHKLYFDPYKARFEPIAWNFRGWGHRRMLNRTENPLLLRLKELPSYLTLRNQIVYRLMTTVARPESVRQRGELLLDKLEPDQLRDPYWDAYHLLPRLTSYHRQMVRPMDRDRQRLIFDARIAELQRRATYLAEELNREGLSFTATEEGVLDLVVSGGGYRLGEITFLWSETCNQEDWSIFTDADLDGQRSQGDQKVASATGPTVALRLKVHPGNALVPRSRTHPRRGAVVSSVEPRRFRLYVDSSCAAERVVLRGTNLVTGAAKEWSAVPTSTSTNRRRAPPGPMGSCTSSVAPGQVGRKSLHPWCYEERMDRSIRLGPGEVLVNETRVFHPQDWVTILPGTTFKFAPGASYLFHGRVHAEGTKESPIRFLPQEQHWGGLAVMGQSTKGSRFEHIALSRATRPTWQIGVFPAMLNVRDTEDVQIKHALFRGAPTSEESLHVVYVEDFVLSDAQFYSPGSDAIDIEFSTAEMKNLLVVGTNDECLDLMGAEVSLSRARFVSCGGNAVSAGEETVLQIEDSLIALSTNGVLTKNASQVSLDSVLLYRNESGVFIEKKSPRYGKKSRLRSDDSFLIASEKTYQKKGGSKAKKLKKALTSESLPRLAEALALEDWNDLDVYLDGLRGQR